MVPKHGRRRAPVPATGVVLAHAAPATAVGIGIVAFTPAVRSAQSLRCRSLSNRIPMFFHTTAVQELSTGSNLALPSIKSVPPG